MSIVTLPIDISFKEWASQIIIDLPNLSIPLPPEDAADWKGWASQVVINSGLNNVPLPTDTAYTDLDDWRVWAAYFINSTTSI